MTRCLFIVSCCMIFSVMADSEISLSGTVKDGSGAAIAGANIALVSDTSVKATTNASGEFTVSGTTAMRNTGIYGKPSPVSSISLKGQQLRFLIAGYAGNGAISIFSYSGKRRLVIPLDRMEPGIILYTLPDLAAGFYVLRISIGQSAATWKLVTTGGGMYLSSDIFSANSRNGLFRATTVQNIDTLLVIKDGFKPLKETVTAYKQTGIALVMDRTKYVLASVKDLPNIKEMPDPLTMNDGTKVTTIDQWKVRRREMIRILEDYEYGHMPPPPGNVKATVATPLKRIEGKEADYRMLHLVFGPNEKCGFDLGLFTPVTPPGANGYPVLIYLIYSKPTESSLGNASKALSRGYAVATINYSQLGADATSWKSSAFFPSYPEYDWRDFSAWAWGISRAVDYLVTDSIIDKDKIMTTGVSRAGQPVLLAGAFDERIALSAPVAGGMALRFSGKEMGDGLGQGITEVVDQGTYWFGPNFEKFRNQTPRLPCDQHWLPALAAPRLFIMCNSYADEYGRAYAAVQTYLGAKPVYEFLKAGENLGMNFREGGHGMFAEDWSALLDFADQKLLKKAGTRKFDVIPPKEKTP